MRSMCWTVALATTILAGPAAAAQSVAVADLSLRMGPDETYPISGAIAAGEEITVHGCTQGNWCEVSGVGIRGWAFGDHVMVAADGALAPVPPVVAVPGAVPAPVVVPASPSVAAPVVVPAAPLSVPEGRQVVTTTTTTRPVVDGDQVEENAAVGGVGGAVMGALIGGPVGALAGAVIGGTAGAAAVEPTAEVTRYVTTTAVEPVYLDGTVAVGVGVPEVVPIYEIPASTAYRYARINDEIVLVDPGTRQVVYVYR